MLAALPNVVVNPETPTASLRSLNFDTYLAGRRGIEMLKLLQKGRENGGLDWVINGLGMGQNWLQS